MRSTFHHSLFGCQGALGCRKKRLDTFAEPQDVSPLQERRFQSRRYSLPVGANTVLREQSPNSLQTQYRIIWTAYKTVNA
jgi:hypothetical protein